METVAQKTVVMDSPEDIALADKMNVAKQKIIAELSKLIVGQDQVVHQVLLTLFVGGNSLIVGVPGLAKTLLVRTLAQVLDLKFNRIQFTPDLMPSDITGTDIIQEDPATGRRQMVFAPGPIFAKLSRLKKTLTVQHLQWPREIDIKRDPASAAPDRARAKTHRLSAQGCLLELEP